MVLLGFITAAWRVEAADYMVDVWTSEKGLPDSSVSAITQTPDGYLWIGTYNGLVRFDGVRFVIFDPANTPALADAGVRKLSVDEQGTLWINTADGSLTSLHHGVFAREWTGSANLNRNQDVTLVSSRSNQVIFLLRSGELRRKTNSTVAGAGWQNLWPTNLTVGAQCLADGEGTIWYRSANLTLSRLKGNSFELLPATSGLTGGRVNCMSTDSQGRLWVGTDKEIAVWDSGHFQNATPTNGEPEVEVAFLSVAGVDHLWAGVNGQVREASGRHWGLESGATTNVFTRTFGGRFGATEDHQGGVWLYDYGLGLSHIAANGRVRRFGAPDGFVGDRVFCFFEDREGNWWLGLEAGGLVRIRERRFQTIELNGAALATPAKSVCEDTNGNVWIGLLGDGLVKYQAGDVTNVIKSGGAKGFIFCVCPDAVGRLWLSAGSEDLYVYETNVLRQILPIVHGVKAVFVSKTGRIWVGTHGGLYFADKPTGAETINFKLFAGTGNKNIRVLAEDESGNLWVGCNDGALVRIAGDTLAEFHPFQNGKATQPIWSLLAEDDGTVWCGTFRGGLLRFRAGQFTRFSLNEGLPNNIIGQILPDDVGNLWLGSHQGILRVAKSALNSYADGKTNFIGVTVFGRTDGLPSLDCSGGYQPAAWRGQDGQLWFTTLKGAVSVRPEEIRPNRLPPNVVIEEVIIDGKRLDSMANSSEENIFKVPPGRHRFEFLYTGISLVSSDRVQFRYRLEGADADWINAGGKRVAEYNLLPPGTYRFRVIACNSDRKWNETGDVLTLVIQPHIYETLWFRVLAGLMAAALVGSAVWYSVTRRLHRKLEVLARQQALERERARIAKDIHDDLGANLTLIARLGHLARQEKTVERVEKMESTARQAIKSLDEIVWAVNPRNDTLAHLIDYTGQFATDYLYAVGVRCLLDVPEHAPNIEVPSNVRHNIFLVVKEALQNIVKHANATEVWLRIHVHGPELKIVIEDNGCGFDRAPADALADGLRNMRQRMDEIGGRFQLQSQLGHGTQVVIETPWSPAK